MLKRETTVAIIALVAISFAVLAAKYLGVDIEVETILSISVTAIAALVRGEVGQRKTDEPK